jgi:hypothetical protein
MPSFAPTVRGTDHMENAALIGFALLAALLIFQCWRRSRRSRRYGGVILPPSLSAIDHVEVENHGKTVLRVIGAGIDDVLRPGEIASYVPDEEEEGKWVKHERGEDG